MTGGNSVEKRMRNKLCNWIAWLELTVRTTGQSVDVEAFRDDSGRT